MLGVKPITLRKWDREGKLKAIRIGSRNDRRYQASDLNKIREKATDQVNWQEYIRDGVNYRILSPVLESVTEGQKEYFGRGLNYLMGYFEGNTMFWYYDSTDLYELGKTIVKRLSDKEFKEYFFRKWVIKSDELLDFLKTNSIAKLASKSRGYLAEIYEDYTRRITDLYKIVICIDATDEALMIDIRNGLREILSKVSPDFTEKELNQAYNVLTVPIKLSYLNSERKELLELYGHIQNGQIKLESKDFYQRAEKLAIKYWWTHLGWARGRVKNVDDIRRSISELNENQADYKSEIRKIRNYEKSVKRERKEIIERYSIVDKNFLAMLELYDELVFYHDFRKELQMKCNFWEYQIVDQIADRTGIPSYLLDWCSNKEIVEILSGGKIDEHELNQRSSKFFYMYKKGEETIRSGKAAEISHADLLDGRLDEVRDLQGLSVSPGTVTGEAYVAITLDSVLKIKPGQILVTGMTMPDYLPAAKKASAIVTDEGGMTCHAAIIARELKIPCIVGTKFGTKIIKTGDKLEVRANHGVIRRLV